MNLPSQRQKYFQFAIVAFNIVALVSFLIGVMNKRYPFIGHDYIYFTSRLFDTYLHYKVNGFSVQWYTPSFAGGLPAYANPQHMQYSLIQLFTAFFDPWQAIMISVGFYIAIGFASFQILANDVLEVDWRAGILGAIVFLGTGFYVGHMMTGQVGFIAFPLLASMVLVLLHRRLSNFVSGCILALIFTSLVYQAGFYTIIIFVFSCTLILPIIFLVKPDAIQFKPVFARVGIAGSLTVFLSSSKLYAVYTFMRYFPREFSDEYINTLPEAFGNLFFQLLGTMNIVPIFKLLGMDPNSLRETLARLSGTWYGFFFWETDNSLSPVLLMVFLFALIRHILSRRQITFSNLSKSKVMAVLILLVSVWLNLEYIFAKGYLYSFLHQLPLLKSMHYNFRFTAVLYMPLALLGTLLLNSWFSRSSDKRANSFFLVFNFLALASLLSYFAYTDDVHNQYFDVTGIRRAYQLSRDGETFPITKIDKVWDWETFQNNASSYEPYEPIFGYFMSKPPFQIHPGLIFETDADFLNLTDPASINFPELHGGKLFTRFKVSDRVDVERYLNRHQLDWNIPAMQIAFNWISFITLILLPILILFEQRVLNSISKRDRL